MVVLGATQVVSRGLSMAVVMLITVIAAEEMPAGSRAYAVSVMTMTGALGAGMCLWALPLTDLGDNGWRLLYVIPLLGIPVTLWVARYLPESRRFARPHRDVAVLRGHGRRMALLGVSFFLISAFGAPATQLMNDFLQDERGFSASRIALFTMLTTTPGGIGLVVGGRMADVRGKRLIVAVGVAGGAALTLASFMSTGWPMWVWNLVGTILAAAAGPALGVYGPELFPTSARGRANGIIQTVSVAGSALGLVVAGRMLDSGGLASAMRPLLIGPLVVAVLVLLFFPETARRELEDLNPEDQGVAVAGQPRSCNQPATASMTRRSRGSLFRSLTSWPAPVDPHVGDRAGDGRGVRLELRRRAERVLRAADEQARQVERGEVVDPQRLGLPGRVQRVAEQDQRRRPGGPRPPPSSTCGRPSTGRRAPARPAARPPRATSAAASSTMHAMQLRRPVRRLAALAPVRGSRSGRRAAAPPPSRCRRGSGGSGRCRRPA